MSNKYQAYAEYKDSGVEWLGDVPEHWNARQLKFLCSCNDEVLFDSVNPDYEIEYVDIGSVSATEGITKTENMTFANSPSRARRIARDGDVIVSTVRTYLEAIVPIDNPPENLVVSTGFAVIRPNQFLQKGYAAYCLRANGFIKEVVARSVGVSYPAINASDLVNIKAPEPSLSEQQKIANFLDHETAKIDTLIEKQQQLIKLLKEKRQAVISHAVTKGLNPNAPMRDSGVEWLGEVPEHWNVKPLKCVCNLIDGDRSSVYPNENDLVDNGIPFVSSKNIVNYKLTKKNLNYITREKFEKLSRGKLIAGDLVITVRGTIGHVGIFDPEIIGCETGFINAQMMIIRPINGLTDYLQQISESSLWQSQLGVAAYGSTVKQLSNEVLGNICIAIPPIDELSNFVSYIKQCCEKVEHLIFHANSAIELMQERRTALISAAVTGKIDVRDWTPPNV